MKDSDVYNTGVSKTENAQLLGFKEPSDDERDDRYKSRGDYGNREDRRPYDDKRQEFGGRGGRGGRGRGGPPTRGAPSTSRGGPSGYGNRPKTLLNENDFPTL